MGQNDALGQTLLLIVYNFSMFFSVFKNVYE